MMITSLMTVVYILPIVSEVILNILQVVLRRSGFFFLGCISELLGTAEEGEEDKEIEEIFEMAKKKKKGEKSAENIALHVENVMAELEVIAEVDAGLNRQGQPAITKLLKLSLLTDSLSKKHLQQEFLDHGVLNMLKNWLEPLPDGSLPNSNVRAAILQILNDFPIDLEQYDRKEQLKKSGLGKVIMFLSKSDEEITPNRKLAKELVDKWVNE